MWYTSVWSGTPLYARLTNPAVRYPTTNNCSVGLLVLVLFLKARYRVVYFVVIDGDDVLLKHTVNDCDAACDMIFM